jgi:hypothetical protein
MNAATRFFFWQKYAGIIAMILLAGALLALADALVGGLKGGYGTIELVPDSRYQISGPMPARTEAIEDFIIDGQPADGSVRLVPEAVFSGYWLGGSMWRGNIIVAPFAPEGTFTLSIKDRFGEKQNPALVFSIRVWQNQTTLKEHSRSLLVKKTGHNPFKIAVALALCGLAMVAANFFLGRLWARHLQAHHCGEIFKLRQTTLGTEITCELQCTHMIQPGMEGTVYRPSGEHLCPASVISCGNAEVLLLVYLPNPVRLGDVICFHLDQETSMGHRIATSAEQKLN